MRVIFADGECPECGSMCGNGGYGPLKCDCGWVGEDTTEEVEAIFDRLFAEGEAEKRELSKVACEHLVRRGGFPEKVRYGCYVYYKRDLEIKRGSTAAEVAKAFQNEHCSHCIKHTDTEQYERDVSHRADQIKRFNKSLGL